MSTARPRVNVPETAVAGEPVRIRTLVSHPMEPGTRRDADGELVPRRIIHRFTCEFEGELVFAADLDNGVAANPYIEFHARLDRSGTFRFAWHDDDGSVYEIEQAIEVA